MPPIDPTKTKRLKSYDHKGAFQSLTLNAPRLYAGSDDYGIHVFDLAADKKEAVARWAKHDNYVSAIVGAKPFTVSGSFDRNIIWRREGKPERCINAHQGWVRDLAVTPDTKLLISAGDDMVVNLWDATDGRLARTLEGHDK